MKKILLIPFVFLSVLSCKQERGVEAPSIEELKPDPEVVELKLQLSQLQEELVEEQNLRLRQNTEQAALLAGMKGLFDEMVSLKEEKPVELVGIAATKPDAVDENLEARRTARLKAQGEKIENLETVSGEVFKDLVISRVTDIGVVFRHRGGVARVSFTDLSAAWQERFYYDEERALLAQKKEGLAQLRLERAAVAAKEKEQKDLDSQSLARLADAVENLNQGGGAPQPVVKEEIIVDAPIILHDRHGFGHGFGGGIINTPIVRPPIVRTPANTIPTVRTGGLNTVFPQRPGTTVRPTITPTRPTTQPTRPTSTPARPTVRPTRPTSTRPTVQRPSSRPAVVRPRSVTPRPTVRPTSGRR